jgi:hypothetical protein
MIYSLEKEKSEIEYNLPDEFITEILKSKQYQLQQQELFHVLGYQNPNLEVPFSKDFFKNLMV